MGMIHKGNSAISGVSQGSASGPMLFIILVNTIENDNDRCRNLCMRKIVRAIDRHVQNFFYHVTQASYLTGMQIVDEIQFEHI